MGMPFAKLLGRPAAPIAILLATTLGMPSAAAEDPARPVGHVAPSKAKKPKAKEPPAPPPPARMWLIAPSAGSPWTLRIDNEGDRPMRIAADVRLLQLEIERGSAAKRRRRKPVRCKAPASMRPKSFPEKRALLLPPGHSYIQHFDPHLLCFGKDATALAGGALVRARLGWDPPPKWSRKPPSAPFIVESTDDPAAFAPARQLTAPPIILSYALPRPDAEAIPPDSPPARPGKSRTPASAPPPKEKPAPPRDKPAAPPPAPPVVDANAPRLELTSGRWSDASSPRKITIKVTAKNAGKRPMTVALRPRMLEFRIKGPSGRVVCDASPATDSVPRDLFRTLKPGAHTSFRVLLRELCPDTAFKREGLYRIKAVLHANESGAAYDLDAYTAVVAAEDPTLLRLRSAPEPFYSAPPRAVPTPDLTRDPEN